MSLPRRWARSVVPESFHPKSLFATRLAAAARGRVMAGPFAGVR